MESPHLSKTSTGSQDDCGACSQLLRHVFERIDSRPHELVASMMSGVLEWRGAENGIQVKIPTEESRPAIPVQERTWARHYDNSTTTTTAAATPKNQSATAALSTNTTTPSSSFGGGGLMQATSLSARGCSPSASASSSEEGKEASPLGSNGSRTDSTSESTSWSRRSHESPSEWMNVSCQVCPNVGPQGKARAYVNGPQPLDVVVCSNRLREVPGTAAAVHEMEEILTHELVHVYDARHLQLDLRECQNLAYSEVRAAREAECGSVPASFGLQASCVRERALLATQNLFPHTSSRECLRKVFPHAMKDARPWSSNHHSHHLHPNNTNTAESFTTTSHR